MNQSIRYRLMAYMTVSIIVFSLLLFGANTFFAEKYYVNHKKGILLKTSKEITQLISGLETASEFQDEELVYALNRLEKSIGGTIAIGQVDGTLYYPTYHNAKGQIRKGMSMNPFVFMKYGRESSLRSMEPYDENSYFVITKDPNMKFETLRYQIKLNNELILAVWIPMAEIAENAEVSNRFTAIVALITVVITGLWVFYISDRFTKPIKEINKTAKRMSELDFSQTLEVKGEDEIAQLSQSINHLSARLDEAVGELNRRNKQLEEDIDRGKKIDNMRREFVSNVSHELKTPIFLIQGYAEGLKANVAVDSEKRRFYCDVIMEEAEKMDVIVKDLLDLSQMESGRVGLNRCNFDLKALIKETIKKLEPVFAENHIEVESDINMEGQINGDPIRIEQILVNYLNNAVNHIDKGKKIKITAKVQGDKAKITVFNTGQHIPQEYQDKIWASFYKVDKARTRSYGGTGLGLAIVKAIQQAHKNQYGVSNVEDGVEFWFDVDIAN